jgi:hypothetical protein
MVKNYKNVLNYFMSIRFMIFISIGIVYHFPLNFLDDTPANLSLAMN